MARLDNLSIEQLNPEQKAMHAELMKTRKRVSGPFGIWLRNPSLADAANKLVLALREHGRLEKRLYELIVLIVVRHWSAQYAWAAHEENARKLRPFTRDDRGDSGPEETNVREGRRGVDLRRRHRTDGGQGA